MAGCEFPLLRRRFLAAAGWLEDAPGALSQHGPGLDAKVPLLGLGGGGRPTTSPLHLQMARDAGEAEAMVTESAPAKAETSPGGRAPPFAAPMALNLSNLTRKDSAPSELQQRREKFAYFEKRCSPVHPNVFLGSDAVARNRELLRSEGVTHVLNCAGHICGNYFENDLVYRTVFLMDTPGEDLTAVLYGNLDFIDAAIAQGGKVLVHCSQGVSRSSSSVISYMMYARGETYDKVYAAVKAVHGIANPNMGFACQIIQWHKRRSAGQPADPPRLYRLCPHGEADPRYIVPKHISAPLQWELLDPRFTFLLHTPTALFVWLGRASAADLQAAAQAAAAQLVRYEHAAPPTTVMEGQEPPELLAALGLDDALAAGAQTNTAYDTDFALLEASRLPTFKPMIAGTALASLGLARPGSAPMKVDGSGRVVPITPEESTTTSSTPVESAGPEAPRLGGLAPAAEPASASEDSEDESEQGSPGKGRGQFESLERVADNMVERRGAPEGGRGSAAGGSPARAPNPGRRIELYEFPEMEQLTLFDGDDLEPDRAFVLLVKVDGDAVTAEGGAAAGAKPSQDVLRLYVWLGEDYDGKYASDGHAIAQTFATEMGLVVDWTQNVQIEKEGEETAEFWGWFENG